MTNVEGVPQTIDPVQQFEVSGRLKAILTDCKMTQSEFAGIIGYKPSYINHVSNGLRPLSGAFIYHFAVHFGAVYDIHWLLTGDGSMKRDGTYTPVVKEDKMIERIERLEQQIKAIIAKIQY